MSPVTAPGEELSFGVSPVFFFHEENEKEPIKDRVVTLSFLTETSWHRFRVISVQNHLGPNRFLLGHPL